MKFIKIQAVGTAIKPIKKKSTLKTLNELGINDTANTKEGTDGQTD